MRQPAKSSSGKKVCEACELVFKDESSKTIYDEYLAWCKRRSILDDAKRIAQLAGLKLPNEQGDDYIGQLTELFNERKLAEKALIAFCKVEKIAYNPDIYNPDSQERRRSEKEAERKAREEAERHTKIKDYFEEPFNPIKLIYENWKLKIIFDDPEKVKGKLTIKAGNRTFLNRPLTLEEIKNNSLEIDYLEKKYFPEGEDEISFSIKGQKKPVLRSIDYFESIPGNNKIRILQQDCCNNSFEGHNLRIAAVQLKYHVYKENSVVKLTADEAYHRKIMSILEAVKEKADIVVFPEFSIPFEYLEKIQQYADENGIIIVAGSHYVLEKNLGVYGKLFSHKFGEQDLRKNISPIVIPDSRIVHNEKLFGAKEERECYSEEGMTQGEVNNILKIKENFRLGVMICYEYLNPDFRQRLIRACDVILVPQTNGNPSRFYDVANSEINNPLCSGNRTYVMVNGAFNVGDNKTIFGGSTGAISTLDKYSSRYQDQGVIEPIDKVMEQFVLITSINTDFNPARELSNAQIPITTRLIHIFEEKEILKDPYGNGKEFIETLKKIDYCTCRDELKKLLDREKKTSLIKNYSPLMNKRIHNLEELKLEEIKDRCRAVLIHNQSFEPDKAAARGVALRNMLTLK